MGNHSICPFAERFTARALPVFLLVSGLFASGCGGDGDSSVSPTSVPTPAPAPTPTPAPPAEMAPRSQSEFDNRVIGKQFTQGSFSLTFLAPGRLREIDQGTAYDGDYRYDYAGANSGMLTYTYDVTGNDPNRERSEVRFVFGSELSGTFEYSYFENGSRRETASGNFELVPAPSVPPPTIGAGSGAALFGAGDRISGFPAGSAGIPRVTSGASVSLSGGRLTITMSRGGYVEYDDYRYTCNASQCRIEDGLVTSGTIERTVAGSAAGGSGGGGSGGGGTGGGTSGNTFGAGDRISGFPAGSAGIPRVTSGASVSLSGGRLTITMSRGGYVEYDDYRYTCNASQCRIEDGLVTSGTIERTVAGSAAGGSGGGGSGGGGTGGGTSGNTFGAGDRISGFPAGSAGIPRVTSGASVSLSGGRLTITMSRGGYVEYDDYRYTCNASQCRIEDGLVTSGTIERTVAGSGAGGSGGGGSGGGGTGGGTSGNTFGAGDRISGFPAGSAGIPRVTSGASVSLSGGRLTITMSRGGYVEYDDYRYTCNASQCRIEDGLVTSGTIERTVAGSAAGGSGGGGSGGGTGGGSSSGNPLVLVGELDCSIETAFPGTLRGTVEGRLRGVRPVSFVIVTGSLIERDGAQRTHELIPDLLGSFEVGETKSFSSSNLFSSDATRFGCEAQLEWTEIGQHRTRSLRVATPIAPVRPSSE